MIVKINKSLRILIKLISFTKLGCISYKDSLPFLIEGIADQDILTMKPLFPLAPRYRLDDEQPWLEGIDPSRHYWITVNSEADMTVTIPGLVGASFAEFKSLMLQFRGLQSGDSMQIDRVASHATIHCVSSNCYAIASDVNGAPVWHLFDQETLESLLMSGHPDWQCSQKDLELGRKMLLLSLQQSQSVA